MSLEDEIRTLIRKEVLYGKELSDDEDARLEELWGMDEALCDRVDGEVEAEAAEAAKKAKEVEEAPAAPPAPAADDGYLEVVCPAELGEGRALRVALPDGREFDVVVPDGVGAGQPFLVGPFPPA